MDSPDVVLDTSLERRADRLRERVRVLYRAAQAKPTSAVLLAQACEELQTALDLVQTTTDALHRQQDGVTDSRQSLKAQLDDYQSLFEDAPDAYLVTNVDGTIRKANRAAAQLIGTDVSRLIGRAISTLLTQGTRRTFRNDLPQLLQVERTEDVQFQLQSAEGERVPVSATVLRVCDSHGKPSMLRWQFRRMTP